MPLLFDRVLERATIDGLADHIVLNGAVEGHRSFTALIEQGDEVYYCAQSQSRTTWEIGTGLCQEINGDKVLYRAAIWASSAGRVRAEFPAGDMQVFSVLPAEVAIPAPQKLDQSVLRIVAAIFTGAVEDIVDEYENGDLVAVAGPSGGLYRANVRLLPNNTASQTFVKLLDVFVDRYEFVLADVAARYRSNRDTGDYDLIV
jgi:hypothetical protein